MPATERFFKNTLQDYKGQTQNYVEVNKDEIKRWIIKTIEDIQKNFPPVDRNGNGGLYVGTAGIAYALYYLSKSTIFTPKETQLLLSDAERYINSALKFAKGRENLISEKSSFLLGNAGVYAMAAAIKKTSSDCENYVSKFAEAAENCKPQNFLRCGSDELFVGRAGYICIALWLAKEIRSEVLSLQQLTLLCEVIVKSGQDYAKAHHSKVPLMYAYYNTEYIGAAHGLSSILFMLMSVPRFLETHPQETELIQKSVDFLLESQLPNGNFPCVVEQKPIPAGRSADDELVHWCHGAPGVIYTLAKAYVVWKDDKYLQACKKCGECVWETGLLRKGPGICHGVAGNGYVFLLLYRLTNDLKYLYRAVQFSEFMKSELFNKQARTPDSPYSLFEGYAGTICFLADLADPKQAAFPFMDVF
ncbi:lanC-like protein 3 [Chrysoperla carnea]|uniref:lanC-like protein 3 n=1 Tax=Chrysoperla carnea TaxID=189513 RepID=UPI001D07C234|nr:lanC-like protein 3 [Chrysoperla carnea]